MKNIKSLLMTMLLIIVIALSSVSAQAAYTVKQQWARMSATAGEALTVGQLVAIADADGYAYKADADVSTRRPAVGIVGKATASGAKVEIIVHGIVTGWSSLAEGSEGYLSETAGAITQSSPSYSQQIGVAVSATDYYINSKNYFDTSAITSMGVLSGATPIIMEGATADAYETTITPTDPTADRTITLPNATGTVALLGIGADPGATCTAGQIYIDTDETVDTNCTTTADNSLCLCTAANTWTALERN